MSVRVNANLYRIVAKCMSNEEMRYYLRGVFVEPHVGGPGVTLTATDGHRLLTVYDPDGECDKPMIVQLSKEALAACKPTSSDRDLGRQLRVTGSGKDAKAEVVLAHQIGMAFGNVVRTVAIHEGCEVDGSFPDYRRVIPDYSVPAKPDDIIKTAFSAQYLESLAEVARDLYRHDNPKSKGNHAAGTVIMRDRGDGSPALITFPQTPSAFAVLMPTRTDGKAEIPSWFRRNGQALQVAPKWTKAA